MSLICVGLCVLFLSGCPSIIADRMKNKRQFVTENFTFSKERYPIVAIVPYSCGAGGGVPFNERILKEGEIDFGYADKIYETCANELMKKGFAVFEKSKFIQYLKINPVDITTKNMALDLSKLESVGTIQKMGTGLMVDSIVAVNVKKLTLGRRAGGNTTELEVFAYDVKTEHVVWNGRADVVNKESANYSEKVFKTIFRSLFFDL